MKRSFLLLYFLAFAVACSSTNFAPVNLTVEQRWTAAKLAGRVAGVAAVTALCKNGKFGEIDCDTAVAHVGHVVDTIADDFKPGAVVNAEQREVTRHDAAEQIAPIFKMTPATARALIVDPIGDALVLALGKS